MKNVVALATILTLTLVLAGGAFAADVSGKVAVTGKVVSIKVSEAKGDDGKVIDALKGKDLAVVGPKVADVEKCKDKEVTAKGAIKGNKEITVTEVKECAPAAAPAAAAPAPAPAPAPAAAAPAPAPAPKK